MDYKKLKYKVGDVVLVKNTLLDPFQYSENGPTDYLIGTIKGMSKFEHRDWEYHIDAGLNLESFQIYVKESQIITKL